jgi:hypothetical protein
MIKAWRVALALALGTGLAGCNASVDVGEAQHAIELFHFELDQAQYGAIWKTTGSAMRGATQEGDFTQLLIAVHGKLGKVAETSQTGWNVNYNTGGTFVSVMMHTRFAHGTADENFLFRSGDKGQMQLEGYHINSMDLITH